MAGKAVQSSGNTGPQDNSQAVGGHFVARPAVADGSNPTADMRDGDGDSGTSAPTQPATTVAGSSAAMAGRGSGTP